MACGSSQSADAFMCRMDQLSQKLNSWRTKTARSATPLRSDSQKPLASRPEREQDENYRSRAESSPKHSRPSSPSHRGSSRPRDRSDWIPVTRYSEKQDREASSPKGRASGSHSPSRRGAIAILSTYDRANKVGANATEWISTQSHAVAHEGASSKKSAPEFESMPSKEFRAGSPARAVHSDARHQLVKAEWQRSRNKLMALSPSRRGSTSPKAVDRSPAPSLSPASRLSRRSMGDQLSPENNPFQMPEEGRDRLRERPVQQLSSSRQAWQRQDGPASPTAFNARVEALQQRVQNVVEPRPYVQDLRLQLYNSV